MLQLNEMGRTKCTVAAKTVGQKKSVVANVNSNHSVNAISSPVRKVIAKKRKSSEGLDQTQRGTRVKTNFSSNAEDVEIDNDYTETVAFEEDDEEIQMEINDGGAAAREFTSDNEGNENETESETDSEVENTDNTELNNSMATYEHSEQGSEMEEGEISSQAEDEVHPIPTSKGQRHSVEERLDNLSHMVMEMKELFM